MTAATLRGLMTLSLKPLVRLARRLWIQRQINSIKYDLAYIAQVRAEHREEERIKHRRQALLVAELARLER